MMIQDGTGNGQFALVDANKQLHVKSVDISAIQDATRKGNSYNINTGTIALTSTSASGVFYFKNDESAVNGESSFILDTIAIGIDNSGTTTNMAHITFIANPTGGTLISGASDVAINANRNLGSSNSLSTATKAYKGAEGNTVTGGTTWGLVYQSSGTRGNYPLDVEIPRGSSFAVTIDTQTTGGTTNVYVALIGHRVDGKNN